MPTFTTAGPIAATVAVAGAQVRVTASDRTDTAVLVEPMNRASRKDVKVADRTRVDFADGQLSVKTTVSGDKSGSVVITIDLPAGSSLIAYLAHSEIHAHGTFGECEVHMASGRVDLDHIDTLLANVGAGELAVGHITGRAKVDGARGEIWIGRADGSVSVKTADGPIRIGRLTYGRAELMNGSGDIEVGISEGTAADVDIDSERGSVRNSVPSPEHPAGSGNDTVTVHARTRHGDILIHRAAR